MGELYHGLNSSVELVQLMLHGSLGHPEHSAILATLGNGSQSKISLSSSERLDETEAKLGLDRPVGGWFKVHVSEDDVKGSFTSTE